MSSLVTQFDVQGPKRGADRAVLLAHGAGSDRHGAALVRVADALADAGIPSLRFDFPYRAAGRRAPDRQPVLVASIREAAALLASRARVPVERVVAGGRSMGGRMCSLAAADAGDPLPALGLVLLGYPLHPPGRPDAVAARSEHFPRLDLPVLFVSGTRDAFGTPAELRRAARRVRGPVEWHWIETGDHGFKPLKSAGVTADEVLEAVATRVVRWVGALPG